MKDAEFLQANAFSDTRNMLSSLDDFDEDAGSEAEAIEQSRLKLAWRETERNYRMMAQLASAAVFVLKDDRFLFVNPAWEKLFGYTYQEAVDGGMVLTDIVAPDHHSRIRQVLLDRHPKQESNFWLRFRGAAKSGRSVDLIMRFSDILWNGELASQAIIESGVPYGKPESLREKSSGWTVRGELRNSAQTEKEFRENERKDGRYEGEAGISSFFPGGSPGSRLFEDILKSLKANFDGREPILHLDYLNDSLQTLRKIFASQEEFLANAAHELKTPLSILRAHWEDELNNQDLSIEMKIKLVQDMETLSRLSHLIDNLMLLTQAGTDSSHFNFETIRLDGVLREVLLDVEMLADNKSQKIEIEDFPAAKVRGDKIRLYELFFNLIDNAIKYSPEKGKIRIGFSTADSNATVEIRDEGIGIPEQDLPYIFERFYRVKNEQTPKANGSGLGLSICKLIAETHNGHIEVDSEIGKGSTFRVHLPLSFEN